MNLRDIETFLAVVETGSIVGASARLHLTQPGITRRIQNLETRLGVALLDRQSKPLKPTHAGNQAYQLGRRVVAAVDDLAAGIGDDAEPAGELRLGITPFLSELSLPALLEPLRREFPKVSLRVVSAWSPELLQQLERGSVDAVAVVRHGDAGSDGKFQWEELGRERVLVAGAADIDLPVRRISLRQLSRHPFVLNQEGCCMRDELQQILEGARLPFEIAVEAVGVSLQISLISQGVGVGLVTERALAANQLGRKLRILDVPALRQEAAAWLVRRPSAERFRKPLERAAGLLRAQIGPAAKRRSS
jgi:DNA-binding transcriptional LysR family regulator